MSVDPDPRGSLTTAAQLMRSRFEAFRDGDADWLLTSWHSSTRPGVLELIPSEEAPDGRVLEPEVVERDRVAGQVGGVEGRGVDDRGDVVGEDGVEEGFLAAVVGVDPGFVRSCSRGDAVDAGSRYAMPRELLGRRVQDAAACSTTVTACPVRALRVRRGTVGVRGGHDSHANRTRWLC